MRTRTRSRWVATAVAVAVCGTLGIGPAYAEDPTEATADLIASVAPDQGQVVEGTVVNDQIVAQTGATEVAVPTDPNQPVVIDGLGAAPPVAVNLPAEASVAKAGVADDGTVVYHATDDSASVAVQVLDDGSARIQTITPDADAPREFTYTFGDGIVPVKNPDGTVTLLHEADGIAVTVGTVGKAWATDAKGKPVATSYRVKDDTLVQTISPSARTAYPVVADPKVTRTWWNTTVYFNKKETGTLAAGTAGVAIWR